MLLKGAHAAAVRPLVETLLEENSSTDSGAPRVRICFDPRELLDVPPGAWVVLVGADRDPTWLNLNRPVIRERALSLLLWTTEEQLQSLRRDAPDFIDWISHRIEVPSFVPNEPAAELRRALSRVKWVAVAGAELVEMASEGGAEIGTAHLHGNLFDQMEAGDILVRGLERDLDLWRLMMVHAQVGWRHRVILIEPMLVPPLIWFVDGRVEGWEAYIRRPGIVVHAHRDESSMGSLPRVLEPEHMRMALLGLIARRGLAWAEGLSTREGLVGLLEGGPREQQLLGKLVLALVELVVARELRQAAFGPEFVQTVMLHLYGDDAQRLRSWDPLRGSSLEDYIRKITLNFAQEIGEV